MKNLNNSRIAETTFEYNGSIYRLTGYMFVYEIVDADTKRAFVNKENATHVTGSGVCGCVAPIDKVIFLEENTVWDEDLIQLEERRQERNVKNDSDRYDFLKDLPKGLTDEEYFDIVIASI